MNCCPDQPSHIPARSDMAGLENCKVLTHDGHVAFVEVAECLFGVSARDLIGNDAPYIAALLDGGLRYARYRVAVLDDRRSIADGKRAGYLRNVQQRSTRHPSGPVRPDPQHFHDRGCCNARCPYYRCASNPFSACDHALLIDRLDPDPCGDRDAKVL